MDPTRLVRDHLAGAEATTRRPAGTLALAAIAATGTLHFTHVLHHSDPLVAIGLTTLTVAYDAVIATHALCQVAVALPLPFG